MRQEVDGPQAKQLEFVPCGQILQDEDNSRREEKLSLPLIKKTPHIPYSQSQGDLPDYTRAKRLLGGQKGSDVNLPIGLFSRIHLG